MARPWGCAEQCGRAYLLYRVCHGAGANPRPQERSPGCLQPLRRAALCQGRVAEHQSPQTKKDPMRLKFCSRQGGAGSAHTAESPWTTSPSPSLRTRRAASPPPLPRGAYRLPRTCRTRIPAKGLPQPSPAARICPRNALTPQRRRDPGLSTQVRTSRGWDRPKQPRFQRRKSQSVLVFLPRCSQCRGTAEL